MNGNIWIPHECLNLNTPSNDFWIVPHWLIIDEHALIGNDLLPSQSQLSL